MSYLRDLYARIWDGTTTATVNTGGALNAAINGYRSSDTSWQPLRLDKSTSSLQTIDYAHHEIHAGSNFFYTDSVELGSAGVQNYLITTPDTTKWAHLTFQGTGSAVTTVQIYEGADRTGTTAQTLLNSDRNSLTAATVAVHKDYSSGTTDGTLIWQRKSGAAAGASRSGAEAEHGNEIILKRKTKYIFRITSGTAANLTNTIFNWYEHTNVG